jgi:hypothetical protein
MNLVKIIRGTDTKGVETELQNYLSWLELEEGATVTGDLAKVKVMQSTGILVSKGTSEIELIYTVICEIYITKAEHLRDFNPYDPETDYLEEYRREAGEENDDE